MKESSVNIERVASNLTKTEFDGYCKGMSTHWLFKALDDKANSIGAGKRVKFWDRAYDKYKYNCKKPS